MRLDGAQRDVELLSDLPVGVSCGGQGSDPVLSRGESPWPGEQVAAGPGACRQQFVAGTPRDQPQASPLRQVERAAERPAGLSAAVGAPQRGPKIDQGPRVLEPGR